MIAGASKELRIGFIGAGMIAQIAHLPAFSSRKNVRFVAICDVRPGLAQQVASDFKVPEVYGHHHQLLREAEIDLVVVCVHRRCAAAVIDEALGKVPCVFSEKPLAFTYEQGGRLADHAARQNALIALGYMRRFDLGVLAGRQILNDWLAGGRAGRLLNVTIHDFCPNYAVPIPKHARSYEHRTYQIDEWPDLPAGLPERFRDAYDMWVNAISHDINLLRFLLPERKVTTRYFSLTETLTHAALFDMGDVPVILQAGKSNAGYWDQSFEFFFESGRIRIDLCSPMALSANASVTAVLKNGEAAIPLIVRDGTTTFERQAENVVMSALNRTVPVNPAQDVTEDLRLIEDIWAPYFA